jgi:hypothetical protein
MFEDLAALFEQWFKDFGGVIKVILEPSDPKHAHAEFDRVVKHRPRGWYTVRWGTQVLRSGRPVRPTAVNRCRAT